VFWIFFLGPQSQEESKENVTNSENWWLPEEEESTQAWEYQPPENLIEQPQLTLQEKIKDFKKEPGTTFEQTETKPPLPETPVRIKKKKKLKEKHKENDKERNSKQFSEEV